MTVSSPAEDYLPVSTRSVLRPARPELAAALVAVIPSVCATHMTRIRREIRAAAPLNEEEALDDLPTVLAAMADLFGKEGGLTQFAMLGPAHATARDAQHFSFHDVTNEYLLLRASLRERIEDRLGRGLDRDEAEVFETANHVLVALTMVSFGVQREARIRLETTAQGHFLASLAHDLRNELQAVLNSLSLLEEAGAGERATAGAGGHRGGTAMDDVLEEALASRRMIESTLRSMTRLLEAERLGAGVIAANRREVLVHTLLSAVIRAAGEARLHLDCPEGLVLHTDPDLLSTVVTNLVGNAIKHAPKGEIVLRVCGAGDGGGGRIEVEDQGPGILPELQARLFDKFGQLAKGRPDGFGLGLFIARRAADLLGGRLEVASVPGVRTVFALQLDPTTSVRRDPHE